ncbi:hypothetical protein K2X40_02595 [Candidatus Babeliales bacterium]|nr:hypothetical protein [Candidatus Babeliales bacterium]
MKMLVVFAVSFGLILPDAWAAAGHKIQPPRRMIHGIADRNPSDADKLSNYIAWCTDTANAGKHMPQEFVDLRERISKIATDDKVVKYLDDLAAGRVGANTPKPDDDELAQLCEQIDRLLLAYEETAEESYADRYYKQRIKELEEEHGVVWDEIDTSKEAYRDRYGRIEDDPEPQPWPDDEFVEFVPKKQYTKTALELAEEAQRKAQQDVEDVRRALKEAEEEDVEATARAMVAQQQKERAEKQKQRELAETKKALEQAKKEKEATEKENKRLKEDWRIAKDALEKEDPSFFKKVDKQEAKRDFFAALKAGSAQCASGAWHYTKIGLSTGGVVAGALYALEIGWELRTGQSKSLTEAIKSVTAGITNHLLAGGIFGALGAVSQATKDALNALYRYVCPEPTIWGREDKKEGGHYIKMAIGTPLLAYLGKELVNIWSRINGRRGISIKATALGWTFVGSFLALVGVVGEAFGVYFRSHEPSDQR